MEKNYQNPLMCVEVIMCYISVVFLRQVFILPMFFLSLFFNGRLSSFLDLVAQKLMDQSSPKLQDR